LLLCVAESVVRPSLRSESVDGVDQPADVDTNITSPTPVVQPLPAATAASPSRKHSETLSPSSGAVYKLGEWTERTTSPTVQLVGFSRINSQRRGAIDKVQLSRTLLLLL